MSKLDQFKYVAGNYSTQLAMRYVWTSIVSGMGGITGKYPASTYSKTSELTYRMLGKKFEDFISPWRHATDKAESFSDDEVPPAWTCWFQGLDTAPPMIQKLVNIQEQHLPDFDYHVITENNFDSFVDLPGYIIDAVQEGRITKTHFTDILRAALLREHGGLWLDATVLVTSNISRECVQSPFFTLKGLNMDFPGGAVYPEVAFWEGYFIAGKKNALFYNFMYEFFLEYWKQEPSLVQYLLINQVAKLGIRNISVVGEEFASIPETNQSCELLGPRLIGDEALQQFPLYEDGTTIFKLSRHTAYNPESLELVLKHAMES